MGGQADRQAGSKRTRLVGQSLLQRVGGGPLRAPHQAPLAGCERAGGRGLLAAALCLRRFY